MLGQYFYFATGIILWISAIIIFIRRSERPFYFLAGHLLIMGFGIFIRSLYANAQHQNYPHLFQLISPLHFLYGPFYFYFLVTFFRPRYQFHLRDSLHLVPFLINLIDYIPFYVKSPEVKRMIIESNVDVTAFGISLPYYNLLKSLSFIFYFILVGLFYLRYINNTRFSNIQMNRLVHFWLRGDYLLKLVALLSYIIIVFIENRYGFTLAYYLFSLDSLLNIFVIFSFPKLLNGIRVEYIQGAWMDRTPLATILYYKILAIFQPTLTKEIFANKLNYFINVQKGFLDNQLDARALSIQLKISEEQLEKYIMNDFGCSPSEYIQYKRLEYLLMKISMIRANTNQPLFKTIFTVGFDSITSFQTILTHYQSLTKPHHFCFDSNLIEQINKSMESCFSN